jgi:hypothetical protein
MQDGAKLLQELPALKGRVEALSNEIQRSAEKGCLDNRQKRVYYCSNEFLDMDCVRLSQCLEARNKVGISQTDSSTVAEAEETLEQIKICIDKNRAQLSLQGVDLKDMSVLARCLLTIEVYFRAFAAGLFLLACSILLAIPCICVKPIDKYLVHAQMIHPQWQLSLLIKRFIGHGILKCFGIYVRRENIDAVLDELPPKQTSIISFSHSCALDAFIFSAALPIRAHAVVSTGFLQRQYVC